MTNDKIKVLIADDSPVVREVLKDMIAGERDLTVVGEARNGQEAIDLAQDLKPDIITMDVIMPVLNGLEAVEEIMAFNPTPILVFSSVVEDKEMDVAFQAIARGALDVLEKPKVTSGDQYDAIQNDLLSKLRMLSRIHVIPHLKGKRKKGREERRAERTRPPAAEPAREAPLKVRPPAQHAPEPEDNGKEPVEGALPPPPARLVKRKLVAVGASTGGPKALVQIYKRLPVLFPLPVLTVQHIAPSFAAGLVNWLNRESGMKVLLAEDRAQPLPGTIYVSPTGVHMVLEKGLIRLTDTPPVNSCKPAVDELFLSIAHKDGHSAVGVLLTGMGRDGAEGLKAMHEVGSRTIIQDEKSSTIFGMPRAAMEIGAADEIVALGEIPEAIIRAVTQ